MKKLAHTVIVLSMVLSMVFLSEAISSGNNPLSVKAQSTKQYHATNHTKAPGYNKKYRPYRPHYGYCYKIIRVKRCRWVKVLRCRWVTKKIRIKCPRSHRPYKKTY